MPTEVNMMLIPLDLENGPRRASEGSAIELADGRLMYVYSHYPHGGHDFDVSEMRVMTSKTPEGTEWTEPVILQPNTACVNTMIASLFRLGTASMTALRSLQLDDFAAEHRLDGTAGGALGLVYFKHQGHHSDALYFRLSRDEGYSWSEETRINYVPNYREISGFNNDSVIVLSNGRIIVPVSATFGSGLAGSLVFYSDDEGYSWSRSVGEVTVDLRKEGSHRPYACSKFGEPNVVELKDGRIMMFGRTITGRIWKSYSQNNGLTWSRAEPTNLASSPSPVSLRRIPSTGDLLLIWNQASGEETRRRWARMRMSCAVSKDDGETWEHFKNLESPDDAGHIEPERMEDAYDPSYAILSVAARGSGGREPLDPANYPRLDESHWHVDYPSLTFTSDNRAVITYGVYGGGPKVPPTHRGTKLRIMPVEWFYA